MSTHKNTATLMLLAATLLLASCKDDAAACRERQVINIDNDWLFVLDADSVAFARADFDDSQWRRLNLPHDWAIEGSFSKDNPSGTGGGALPGGVGWYRKHFRLSDIANGPDGQKQALVKFGGVYMNSSVYLNGHLLGTRPYGYISFEYDMTPWLHPEGDNVLAVRVDNSVQPNSRWYSGCGIYRSVYVTMVGKVHIEPWDTYLLSRHQKEHENIYWDYDSIVVGVRNTTDAVRNITQVVKVLDADGTERYAKVTNVSAPPQQLVQNGISFSLQHPVHWSVDNPYLYTMKIELKDGKKVIDDYSFRFGIRDFRFDAEHGFALGAEPMRLNGVCLHHDLGCLGAAVNRRAIQRQLEIMRGCGVNAIRCSHNPPSEELLDLCDEMGFLVMDESFDMWRRRKTQRDYARFFDEWHKRDLSDLVRRDRNHPSIVMWSIGNEVLEQWNDASADTLSLEQANMILNAGHDMGTAESDTAFNVNQFLTRHLCSIIRSLDSSRPITAGCNAADPRNNLFCEGGVDVVGFNYHEYNFPKVPEWFPGKPFIISESVSSLHTRGHYRMPSDSIFVWPSRWDKPFYDSTYMCSAYDNCHAPWSSTHECNLRYYDELPYISGQFIWSGFDYLGEPTPYGWPARSSYFGIVDLAGFPKDAYYLYQSVWTEKPMLHVFPHWNWQEGDAVDVWAYFNQADEAELFINGRSQGVRTKGGNYHTVWKTRFEPGELKVVTRRAGTEVMTETIHTAGEPYAVRLTPDRDRICADGRDLSFVEVEVIDKEGNLCPNADNRVEFRVDGHAFVCGVDNGCQTSLESFKAPFRKAFHGKCLVVVQNDGHSGKAVLTATSDGLKSAKVTLNMKR